MGNKNKSYKKVFSMIFIASIMFFSMASFASAIACGSNADCPSSQTCDTYTNTCESISPLDFWSIFVEQTFGNFWYAVMGLAMIYFIILLLGRVSMYSVLSFMIMFFICMALGYGYTLLTVAMATFIFVKFVYDLFWVIGAKII